MCAITEPRELFLRQPKSIGLSLSAPVQYEGSDRAASWASARLSRLYSGGELDSFTTSNQGAGGSFGLLCATEPFGSLRKHVQHAGSWL